MQGFCDSKQAHSHQHNFNAIQKLGNTTGVARLAGNLVHAYEAYRKTHKKRSQSTHRALAEHCAHRRQR